jgi:type I restriction enzyme, R subunit
MNEAETRAELIDPALRAAGWGVMEDSRVRREVIAPGRLLGAGKRAKAEIADYVLVYRNRKLAVIEAKRRDVHYTEGLGQAKAYAQKLTTRFAYATNGLKIYRVDMETGAESDLDRYPTPDELWQQTFAVENEWRNRFAAVPFEAKGGSWTIRYYQEIAANAVLDAIAKGRERVLLTLATGTGKTSISFQIAWKLFQARWNLRRNAERRPRILFLADRNNLANQAFNDFTSFAAFSDDALCRIDPADIRKRGAVPTNASVFFTIFQTFMSGRDAEAGVGGAPSPYFGEYPADFFDFIIVDECHRGGANDESTWRAILEYFSPAVQLGLTATPKRQDNVDTYAYFGEPVFIYSLKDGINDGFLTPFKVKQIGTTLDEYQFVPDDVVVEGEVDPKKRYLEEDFNRVIIIPEREAYRVKLLMSLINQSEKTLVFCATQDHAAMVRDLINQQKTSKDPDYCVRVTANDGARGDEHLRNFQDNDRMSPVILTTSQKLSTGVDARNVRNIVLMRPVGSMIEFKQIIGRGTRLFDGKDYFTIYDFVKAHHHFSDAEWDGEPEDNTNEGGQYAPTMPKEPSQVKEPNEGELRPKKIKIKLRDGKERSIQNMMATSFYSADGRMMSSAQFLESLFGALPEFFKDEDELRAIWSRPDTRKVFMDRLAEKGFAKDQMVDMQKIIEAEKSDLFDVLAFVAFAMPPVTRAVRAADAKSQIHSQFNDKQEAFLDFVLTQYVREGVEELDQEKLSPLLQLKYSAIADALGDLGTAEQIRDVFVGFQKYLYQERREAV